MSSGGKRAGAGRKKGVPNKSTASLKAAFQKHKAALVAALVALTKSKDENVQLRAIQTCFDRGWGKAAQPLTGADGGPIETKDVTREGISDDVDRLFADAPNDAADGEKVLH